MKIRALSIKQPWATMIAIGRKTIETRTWQTSYRGPVLIVSSKLPDFDHPLLPTSSALAIAELSDIWPMLPADELAACCSWHHSLFSWELQEIRLIREPFFVRGQRGLYEVEITDNIECAL